MSGKKAKGSVEQRQAGRSLGTVGATARALNDWIDATPTVELDVFANPPTEIAERKDNGSAKFDAPSNHSISSR